CTSGIAGSGAHLRRPAGRRTAGDRASPILPAARPVQRAGPHRAGRAPRPGSTHVTSEQRAAYRQASADVASLGCHLPWRLLAATASVVASEGKPTLLDGSHGYEMADSDKGRYDASTLYDGPVGAFG